MITLSHAKLVQQLSNVLLLGDEYVLWILNHLNAQIVVKMSQICHLEVFLQLFFYGCNVAFHLMNFHIHLMNFPLILCCHGK
jgi:hypothetical protein